MHSAETVIIANKRADILATLRLIPADLPYHDWFHVGSALKHEGFPFEVFDEWSQTAPHRYDANAARTLWNSCDGDPDHAVTAGSIFYLAARHSCRTAPEAMLTPPASEAERQTQFLAFLGKLFLPGDCFELATSEPNGTGVKRGGKMFHVTGTLQPAEWESIQTLFATNGGVYIGANPRKAVISGKAASDNDVTDYRYAVIEADNLSQEEQWAKLRTLKLPILSVVWSGGKSLHALVKIDAGNDKELYQNRVRRLYDYLKAKDFSADPSNKNASRLTRAPGFLRNGELQYLVAEEFGYQTWADFELIELKDKSRKAPDGRSITSPQNGQAGGRPPAPVTALAQSFLDDNREGEIATLRFHQQAGWFKYVDGVWKESSDEVIMSQVVRFLQARHVQDEHRISSALVNDILLNLKGLCGSTNDIMPCWLPNEESASDVVRFSNGIMDIGKLITDMETPLIPNSPRLFSTDAVDFDYNPGAECPLWDNYLRTTFDSEDDRQMLQNIFGYILSGKLDKNVGFFFVGEAGTGKSVAARVLSSLISREHICCIPFANLGDRFNSAAMTNHKLNLVEELPINAEQKSISDAEKIFKMITGGADIPVEKKFECPTTRKAIARCVFCTNELPSFTDRTEAIWDRCVVLPFTHRFRGTEEQDPDLEIKLLNERAGIFNWAIAGARALQAHRTFPLSKNAQAFIEQHKLECNHELCFLLENVCEADGESVSKKSLYTAYRNWSMESGYIHPCGKDKFKRAVQRTFPQVEESRFREGGDDKQIWKNIKLRQFPVNLEWTNTNKKEGAA